MLFVFISFRSVVPVKRLRIEFLHENHFSTNENSQSIRTDTIIAAVKYLTHFLNLKYMKRHRKKCTVCSVCVNGCVVSFLCVSFFFFFFFLFSLRVFCLFAFCKHQSMICHFKCCKYKAHTGWKVNGSSKTWLILISSYGCHGFDQRKWEKNNFTNKNCLRKRHRFDFCQKNQITSWICLLNGRRRRRRRRVNT